MLRLFTGISIPADVISNIEAVLAALRPLADAKWSPPENLHITTRFIGAWPEPRIDELKAALGSMETAGAIPIEVAGFGFFPNARRPKVFFTNVNGGDRLPALAAGTDRTLAAVGLDPEDRPYSPHLTLARIGGADARPLLRKIESMDAPLFGRWQAEDFHLYLSRPGSGASVYTVLASWPLAKETAAA